MDAVQKLLQKWSRRRDVEVTQWGEYDVLRFGKGGSRGVKTYHVPVPYNVPGWVKKRIKTQRERLAGRNRLQRI